MSERPAISPAEREPRQITPKLARVCAALRTLVDELPAGAALPPILALRERLQVSQHLIDRAVGQLREDGLLESRRGSGIYVTKRAKTLTVGILSQLDLFRHKFQFFGLLAKALHVASTPRGIRIRHYFVDPHGTHGYEHFDDDVRTGQLDGVIGLGVGPLTGSLNALPFVSDGEMYLFGDQLISLAVRELVHRGCRRLALLHHDPSTTISNGISIAKVERAQWRAALQLFGLERRPEWVMPFKQSGRLEAHWGYEEFTRLWTASAEKPDGLVSLDDNTTLGMLFAAEQLGVRVPDDLQVASHANSLNPHPDASRVIRLDFDTMEIAETLLDRLQRRIDGQPTERLATFYPRPAKAGRDGA